MRTVTLAALVAAATACAQAKSSDVSTDSIYADIDVEATGDGTSLVKATLKVGGATSNTFLELTDGDALTATSGAAQQVLTKQSLLGAIWYESRFPGDAADAAYKVSFLRTGAAGSCNSKSAPNSQVTLPAPFTIGSPTPGGAFSRANDAISVAWSPAAPEPTTLMVSGTCLQGYSLSVAGGASSATIAKGALLSIDPNNPQGCQATVSLARRRSGTLDPGYGSGGGITATQSRSVSITSNP